MRILASIITLCVVWTLQAQERPVISSAIIAIRDNDVATAKKYIDEADQIISSKPVAEVREKDLVKFYYYKGLINLQVMGNPELNAQYPDALSKAYDGYTQSIALEDKIGKSTYKDRAQSEMGQIAVAYANEAIAATNEENFQKAYDNFMKTYQLKKDYLGTTDTAMLNNASLMAQSMGDYDEAIRLTKQLIAMDYKGVNYLATNVETGQEQAFGSKEQMEQFVSSGKYKEPRVFGDIRPELYVSLANMYLTKGDTAQYQATVGEGRSKYPGNGKLLQSELQIFLINGEFEKALDNLDQGIALQPDNKMFYYVKGNILQTKMQEYERAMEAYDKALELDSNYADPLYMQGLLHVSQGNEIAKEMNELPLSATSKYEELKSKMKESFAKALPYFEKAYEVNPRDKDTVNALAEVYQKIGDYEKAKKMKQEAANL